MKNLKEYFTREGWRRDLEETKKDYRGMNTAMGIGVSAGTAQTALMFFGNPVYHLSGFATGLVATIADLKSTTPVIRLSNNPKFKRLGLNSLFMEENMIIGKHPTMEQYERRGLVSSALMIAVSTLLPPLGYGYLAGVPFIVKQNHRVYDKIQDKLDELRNKHGDAELK